ncbi:hypothetical protein [Euzebya pacifica]|uniref:hypothetical protein n=1 Tax=Euzebya pacifica TaxID=1608957 RepID=UPI0030F7CBDE
MAPSIEVQLLARIDELARREGLLVAETGKARIYRDRVGGTVAWLPHGKHRTELTLIHIRIQAEARANRLHCLLLQTRDRTTPDIPSNDLGLDAALAVEYWSRLERDFFPAYLHAHRDVQSSSGRPS